MSVLPIIKIGHPILRKKAMPVTNFDDELRSLVDDMIETMRINEGIGLAAPQVNVQKRFFVIDRQLIDEELEPQAYINPNILQTDGNDIMEEGCLSIPGIREEVDRPFTIEVEYQTVTGDKVSEVMKGVLARVFQHEYDHLEGVLFIDRISLLKKKLLKPQLEELKSENLSL